MVLKSLYDAGNFIVDGSIIPDNIIAYLNNVLNIKIMAHENLYVQQLSGLQFEKLLIYRFD